MTDPIQVLRDSLNMLCEREAGESVRDEGLAALAQMEALVEAAQRTANDYPYEGRFVRDALAPFKENSEAQKERQ